MSELEKPSLPPEDPTTGGEGGDSAGEDFASLLAQSGRLQALRLNVGDRVRARVIHIGREDVFCELSPTQEAVMPKTELVDAEGKLAVRVGDTIDAFVVSQQHGIQLSKKLGRDVADVETLIQAARSQLPVEGLVTGVNKGGIEVAVAGLRAFCPMGQVDLQFIEDPQVFVGKTLQFVVKEVRENGRSVVLSRRALLEAERAERAKAVVAKLEPGLRVSGTVTRVADFGAFVDLGGIEGLVPVSELSHVRIDTPHSVVKEGEELQCQVLRIEPDAKRADRLRITLSVKAILPDPFTQHQQELVEGAQFSGRVTRIEKYGAFVEIFPGLEGLVHISEMSNKRVRHPSDVVSVGDQVTVRVLGATAEDKRVSLSLKEAAPEPGELAAQLAPGTLVEGTVERVERYGVFVKLAGGASALLPAAESGTPPGADLNKAFPAGSTHSLAVVSIDERGRVKVSKRAREAAEERAVLDDFQRRQQQGSGRSLGTLGDLLRVKDSAKGKK